MAAKKGAKRGKKKVTVEIDEATLLKLAQVAEALSEVAFATLYAASDPAKRRALTKKAKRSKKR